MHDTKRISTNTKAITTFLFMRDLYLNEMGGNLFLEAPLISPFFAVSATPFHKTLTLFQI